MMDSVTIFLEASNYLFTGLYVAEMLVKIVAVGFADYFRTSWNRFDAFVAVSSLVGCSLGTDSAMSNSSALQAVRILRVARILKLMKVATGLASLLTTVWSSMPQVMCMGLILLILFIAASALGIELFGEIDFNSTNTSSGLSDHANFKNAALAGLTLFRIATGDNWVGIMRDTLASDIPRLPVVLYYVFFVVTAQFVLLNVVVAVLMKNLTAALQWVDVDTGELATDSPVPIVVDALDPSKLSPETVLAIEEHSKIRTQPQIDKFTVRPANSFSTDGSEHVESSVENAGEIRTLLPTNEPKESVPGSLARCNSLEVEEVLPAEAGSSTESGNQICAINGSATKFLQPQEKAVAGLLENLQERTARLSVRHGNVPGIEEPPPIGAARNKRALKASLHLVMAMVKMSGIAEPGKSKDGSRPVRLSIRRQVGAGRQSVSARPSVNSRNSVRLSVRPGGNQLVFSGHAPSRTSVRSSIRSSVSSRPSFRTSVGTRPSINSYSRRNSTRISTRSGFRNSLGVKAQHRISGHQVIPETIVTPPRD